MSLPYIGSGPYCYANSLAMVLGRNAPEPSAIEVLTGSPFGVHLMGGVLPFFDPAGWDPGIGIDAALERLAWTCDRTGGGDATAAIERLRGSAEAGPVLVGPVEMGLLSHQPGSGIAIGADHYVVVLEVDGDVVCFHDPHGHPFATLPVEDFAAAWRAESIGYASEPFVARAGFERASQVDVPAALRSSLPAARRWASAEGTDDAPAGAAAIEALAELIDAGLEPWQRGHLVHFAVRVGARRLADAATWLSVIGCVDAASVASRQARLLGALQHRLVVDDRAAAVATLRELGPTYAEMPAALSHLAVDEEAEPGGCNSAEA